MVSIPLPDDRAASPPLSLSSSSLRGVEFRAAEPRIASPPPAPAAGMLMRRSTPPIPVGTSCSPANACNIATDPPPTNLTKRNHELNYVNGIYIYVCVYCYREISIGEISEELTLRVCVLSREQRGVLIEIQRPHYLVIMLSRYGLPLLFLFYYKLAHKFNLFFYFI